MAGKQIPTVFNPISETGNSNIATMSSREIAELTGKNHADVMRDIRNMLQSMEVVESRFAGYYIASNGKKNPCFNLDRYHTEVLVTGYDINRRAAVIKRWYDLETGAAKPAANLSKLEILQMAIQSEQERVRLEQENKLLESCIEENAPRVEFALKVEAAPDAISVAQAAKILDTGRTRLFDFLRQIGWITRRNEPYQDKIEAGYLGVKLGNWEHPNHGLKQSVTTLITGKGLAKLQQLLKDSASSGSYH